MNTTSLTAPLTPNPTEPSRYLTISHIAPALALSACAVGLTAAWYTIGPRQDLLDTMRLTLLVGLAVFVANGGYALIRFGNPRRIENRRGWAAGIAAGLPFFPLLFAALSVASVSTITVTNTGDAPIEDLSISYPSSQTGEFDLGPGQARTFHLVPEAEGEVVLSGHGADQTLYVAPCCALTVDFAIN